MTMELKERLDGLLREEQVINCVTCAFCIVSYRRGLNPRQQIDFNMPMGCKKVSPEEELHQDLVWIYHQLPPHDQFDPAKAESGYYRQLKFDYLNNFWENYDPEHKSERRQHIPLKKYKSHSKGLRPSRPTRRKNHAI